MPRRTLIAGNWKMHLTLAEAAKLATAVGLATTDAECEVMIAPPFTSLPTVAEALRGTKVLLGSQNACWADKGAFTGEISPLMLKEIGCTLVILGHSERRHLFHEDNSMINLRLQGVMSFGLIPVLCIGETLEQRQNGHTIQVLESQLREGLAAVTLDDPNHLIIAYEPVWAIGTGQTASTEQAQDAHAFIRTILADLFKKTVASGIRILYGGSVKSDNVDALMGQADIDGALVGGAALQIDSFARIIHHRTGA
ncbi:MAG: triose-phosphate isomerase [Proteobacteria bacterium]|nr:triose-phosphate isomerase [Desulfobulbaceae bacterium]MBU4153272.1 triose-phosphate isomerase [Pseudomonadota bacterium]MDP2105770.1 triose-phosphate isomerase [Desulfobulbaceae bacterium]